MAEAVRLHLPHEAHLAGQGELALQVLQDVELALGLKLGLELGMVVEIVLDGLLAAAHDEDEVLDAGRTAFGHDVRQDGPVDDIEQVLGGGLADRQNAGAQPRDGKNGDTNRLHLTSLKLGAPLEEAWPRR